MRRVRTTRKLKRQHMLWMLLTILVLATASQAPVISLIHRQLGTRHSLKAVLGGQPALPGPGLAAPDRDVDLISAAYHLQEANMPLDIRRSRLSTYRTMGVVELFANRLPSARQRFLHQLEVVPGDVLARYFLGRTYLQLGDVPSAIAEWERAGARDPLRALADDLIERKVWSESLAALDAVIRLDATDLESRRLAARIWREQGDAKRALALYQEIIALSPREIEARWLAAAIWQELGDTERALALSQDIIAVSPEQAIGYALGGQILFEAGKYEAAIPFLEQALERNPANAHSTLVRLGRAHAALGQWLEAASAYRQAIQDDPTQHWDYALTGDAHCQLGHPGQALSFYQQAVRLGNQNARIHEAVAHIAEHGECPP